MSAQIIGWGVVGTYLAVSLLWAIFGKDKKNQPTNPIEEGKS